MRIPSSPLSGFGALHHPLLKPQYGCRGTASLPPGCPLPPVQIMTPSIGFHGSPIPHCLAVPSLVGLGLSLSLPELGRPLELNTTKRKVGFPPSAPRLFLFQSHPCHFLISPAQALLSLSPQILKNCISTFLLSKCFVIPPLTFLIHTLFRGVLFNLQIVWRFF